MFVIIERILARVVGWDRAVGLSVQTSLAPVGAGGVKDKELEVGHVSLLHFKLALEAIHVDYSCQYFTSLRHNFASELPRDFIDLTVGFEFELS